MPGCPSRSGTGSCAATPSASSTWSTSGSTFRRRCPSWPRPRLRGLSQQLGVEVADVEPLAGLEHVVVGIEVLHARLGNEVGRNPAWIDVVPSGRLELRLAVHGQAIFAGNPVGEHAGGV